ncbi:cyclase family protein [Haloechinothrix aidingensis]
MTQKFTMDTSSTGECRRRTPDIETVREIGSRCSNWARWGADDQLGTLNNVTPANVVAAASLIRTGRVMSLSVPFGSGGPQHPGSGRFNPIHLMSVDGRDFMAGSGTPEERDRRRGYLQNADDILILPLQAATQWDGLAHVFFEQQMYNGYSASYVTSSGAQRNAITGAVDKIVGRGVLLDLPAVKGTSSLDPGYAIGAQDLEDACTDQGVTVGPGDFVLIRTGAMARVRERGEWADYAGGDAPGLGLDSADWLHERDIAGVATDTWALEVVPSETPDVSQPLHIIFIVHMGLWLGEIFDLEELARTCHEQARHEFFFAAQPLKVTGGIGSPINPLAVF